jgi:hypothetical protein
MKRLLILILILSGAEISAAAIRKAVAATGVVAASKALSLVHADHEPVAPNFGYMKQIEDSLCKLRKTNPYQKPAVYIDALEDLRDGVVNFGEAGLPKSIREAVELKMAMGKPEEIYNRPGYMEKALAALRKNPEEFFKNFLSEHVAFLDTFTGPVFLAQFNLLLFGNTDKVLDYRRQFVERAINDIGQACIEGGVHAFSEEEKACKRQFVKLCLQGGIDISRGNARLITGFKKLRLSNNQFSNISMLAFGKNGCDFELLKNLRYVCPLNEFNRSENHWDYSVAKRAAEIDNPTEALDYLISNSDDSTCRDWVKEALNAAYLVHEIAGPCAVRAVRFVPEAEQRLISRLSLLDYEKSMPLTKLELLRSVHLFGLESSINLSNIHFSKQDLNEMVQHFDLVTSENLTLLVQHGQASCDQIRLAIEASVWNRDNKDHMLGALAKVEQAIKNQRSDLQSSVEEPKPKSAWWRHGWLRRI